MNDLTLNEMLLSAFPELGARYKDLFPWADNGDEEPDGAHVVYGSLLENRIETLLFGHDYSEAKPYLDYCEKILSLNDDDATNVIAVSVIEDLFYSEVDKAKTRALLGPLAKKEWDDCAKYETEDSGTTNIATAPAKEANHLKDDKRFDKP